MTKYFCDLCLKEVASKDALNTFEGKRKPKGIKELCDSCGAWWSLELTTLEERIQAATDAVILAVVDKKKQEK